MTKGLGYRRAIGAVTRSHNDGLTEASATNLVPVGAVYADPPALLPPTKSDSWVSATNGDWGTGANWSTGKVPGASTNTSIAVAGSYTVTVSISEAAKSLTIDNAGATLADNASLKIGKSLSVLAGTLALGTGAEIVGGTLSLGTSAVLLSTSGTLSGITYEGSLYFDESHASLYLTNGITLTGSGGTLGVDGSFGTHLIVQGSLTGVVTIDDDAFGGELDLYDTRTLDNGTLTLGTGAAFGLYDDTGHGATLTLGSHYVVNASFSSLYSNGNDTLINHGTVNAGLGSDLGVSVASIINQGNIVVSNNGSMSISGDSFTNSGVITVTGSGSLLTLEDGWVNTGTISITDATLVLGDTFTSAALDSITDNGGTILVTGLLNNSGTLNIGPGSQFELLGLSNGGMISGGTISDSGGGLTLQNLGGTLSGVTYEGLLTVSTGSYAENLTISNDTTLTSADGTGVGGAILPGGSNSAVTISVGATLTVTGAGTLSVLGGGETLIVEGALVGVGTISDSDAGVVELDGTRTLDNGLLSLAYLARIFVEDLGQAATLTLGKQYLVDAAGAECGIDLGSTDTVLINQGLITVNASDSSFTLNTSVGTVTNQGSITVSNGDSMTIGGSSFTNTGAISVSGAGTLSLQTTMFTNLSGTTLKGGNYEVDAGSTLQLINNAIVATDGANITLSGANAVIESLNTTTNQQITLDCQLSAIAATGTLSLLSGRNFAAEADKGSFTVAGLLDLGGVTFAATSFTLSAGGSLTGYGTVNAPVVDAGTVEAAGGLLSLGAVTGIGTLAAATGAVLDLTGGGQIAQRVLGAGTLQLDGTTGYTLSGSDLLIASIAVDAGTSLGGPGTLQGALSNQGSVYAATGMLTVDGAVSGTGSFVAGSGAVLDFAGGGTLAGKISGSGTLQLDGASVFTLAAGEQVLIGSVLLDHGATLSGAGTFANAMTDNGALIASAGGTLAFYGALTGTGTLSAGAGGLLDMKTGVVLTETIAGAGVLELEGASNSLAGGTVSIGTLALATGATLSGAGTITSSLIDNGTVTAAGGGTLVLSNAISGNGMLQAATNSMLDLAAGGSLNNAVSGAGVLELSGAYTLGTGALSVAALLIDPGASLTGKGTLTSTLYGTGFGSLVAASGGTLTLAGGGNFAGALAGPGTIDIADALTLYTGASLSAANIIATADIYLDGSASVTQSAASTLTLETAGNALLDLSGYGANFTEAGSLVSNGAGTASVNVAFTNLGSVTLTAGKMQFLAAVTNNGTIDAAAGVLKIETAVGGSGTLDVGAEGTLSLLAGAATGQTLSFLSTTGLLDLTKPIDFQSLITGFGASDQIDLLKTKETSFSYANNTLTVLDGHKTEATLHFAGTYTQSDFTLASDGHSGTVITFV